MTKEEVKTPEEYAEEEVNKQVAKEIAKRSMELKRIKAQKKKLEKEIEKIKSGELVLDGDDSPSYFSNKENNVIIVLDESGSMSSIRSEVIDGMNTYFKKLKESKMDYKISLYKFGGSRFTEVFKNKSIDNIRKLVYEDYCPNGGTPLYDAVGKVIDIHKKVQEPIVVIYTDGEENSSKEYKYDDISSKITDFSKKTLWEFVYMGADQDAWKNASSLGFSRGSTISLESSNFTGDWEEMVGSTINYCNASNTKGRNKTIGTFFKD